MSKESRPKTLKFIGPRDANGAPLEWFGANAERDGIPASDMDEAAVSELTGAQWKAIESEAGQRLYAPGKSDSTASRATDAPGASKPSS